MHETAENEMERLANGRERGYGGNWRAREHWTRATTEQDEIKLDFALKGEELDWR